MLNIFKSKKFVIYGIVAVIVIVVAVFSFNNGNGKQTAIVRRADIVQEVASTGKVKPNQSVDLGFDKSGRVESVSAEVGDSVVKGQIIASLESGEIGADIAKARALLNEEIIKLREIQNTAPISYDDAYKNLEVAMKEGFSSADNAVRNRADQFFVNSPTNPQFEVSFSDGYYVHYFNVPSDLVIVINNDRKKVEDILNNWEKKLATLDSSKITSEANLFLNDLNTVSRFLDKVASAVNTFTPAEYSYETTVNTYKTTIASARTEVSGSISSIVVAKDKLNSAPTLTVEGQFESVLTQEAKVSQARANLASFEAMAGKSTIRAPFDGTVTVQDAKVGETVSAGAPLVSINSNNAMYIEANISEINIGKISENNNVAVSFDAFPNEVFQGFVSNIEPGDFIIDGVVNYKVRVELINFDPKIKNGLTTNLKIETAKKEGVLTVPLYAISKEGDRNYINKVVDNNVQKIEITLGLTGSNGTVEVINGLNEGDLIGFE